jgi:asparagine synthase (glutamine-hydrolysing)
VALSGDGGDEVFAGYPTYQAHRVADWYARLPRLLRDGVVAPLARRLPVSLDNLSLDFVAKRFVAAAAHPREIRHALWLGSFAPAERDALLTPAVREALGADDPFGDVARLLAPARHVAPLDRLLYLDTKLYLENDILAKVDRASMACSLEVRVPLLDHHVVELVAAFAPRLKLRGFTTKYVLKRAMRGLLPPETIARRKKGFGIPVARWLNGELRGLVDDALDAGRLRAQGLFEPAAVGRLVAEHRAGTHDHRKPLYTLLAFQLWAGRALSAGTIDVAPARR